VERARERRERVSELVGERREKFVLAPVALAKLLDENGALWVDTRAVERNRSVRREPTHELLGAFGEDARLGMPEK
jgi:hypothetical protein